ncbi:TIMP2 inhibitor, partial [Aegotheles bennettii]|nr:TIMP2 inhibitor [Aegotheles bennettii]
VIRAKAVSAKEVDSGNDIYGNPIKRIQYEIKQIKVRGVGCMGRGLGQPPRPPLTPAPSPQMFKGPDKDIEFIYTAPSTAVCGRLLDTGGKKEYLIAGKSEGNGKMHITLCDLVATWDSLSPTQKKSLNQRYQMGCECKVSPPPPRHRGLQHRGRQGLCGGMLFPILPGQCWAGTRLTAGDTGRHYACIKRSDGSCAWYRGMAPPKQEFLDIEDP